jgi:hypothetical protein
LHLFLCNIDAGEHGGKTMLKRIHFGFVTMGLLLSSAPPLSGQSSVDFATGSSWLVGYVANAPHQLVGAGTLLVSPSLRGWGVYADAKLSSGSPGGDPTLASLAPVEAEALGDQFFRNRSAWISVNLAAVRPVSRELALYIGGGISRESAYAQYRDPSGERGHLGHYWVEDVERSRVHPNVIGGAFFRIGDRLAIQFGAEAAPAGFSAGGHFLVK